MIPIRNVYYMLTYAFRVLQENGYRDMETESFDNIEDMFAAILYKGIRMQIRRGIQKDYVNIDEQLFSPKGKININESIKCNSFMKNQLVCSYSEFTEDSYLNKILKTTTLQLLNMDVSYERKKDLRKLLPYFQNVSILDLHNINWHISYNRNNQNYHMLVSICHMIIQGVLQTQNKGSNRLMDYFDEQKMYHLYEKFILEYYRKHHKELDANAEQIQWQLDDDCSDLLPIMQTDITLKQGNRVLIIDAKYYTHNLQKHYDIQTINSGNVYQIFTYVKNKEASYHDVDHCVTGMLLYANTDENPQFCKQYKMSGNTVIVRTLDLNCEFEVIKNQLDAIVNEYFIN